MALRKNLGGVDDALPVDRFGGLQVAGVVEKTGKAVAALDHVVVALAQEADADRDRRVTREELIGFLLADNTPADFVVADGVAVMSGVIGADTPAKVLRLALEHPEVRTIAMSIVPGSIDDEANLVAARLVRDYGWNTTVPSDGVIASGGVDFFVAGVERTIEEGAQLGVHTWGGGWWGQRSGADLPRDDPEHGRYLDYYAEMGIPAAFYWFTLDAAPADSIHNMTPDELVRYGIVTGDTR